MFEGANKDIREAIKSAGLKSWQVAYSLGLQDSNFSKMLRIELPDEKKERILSVIRKLNAERRVS